jgi:uncharacterized repeat protein (TIGR03803 family)
MEVAMKSPQILFRTILWTVAIAILAGAPLRAQTYTVIHDFQDGLDGAKPNAGLTVDVAGNLYGTTPGDNLCCGTVFKLNNTRDGWVVIPLYRFRGGNDGNSPGARVVFGPDGALYGTTEYGGGPGSPGTIFKLWPAPHTSRSAYSQWAETIVYRFTGGSDGASPWLTDLIFDVAGNIYGTSNGGPYGAGAVFELTPTQQGWRETTLYDFTGQADGMYPVGTLIFDGSGNLYGTAGMGGGYWHCFVGNTCGTVYELLPSVNGWTLTVLHAFRGGVDGGNPIGGLTVGSDGYMYGNTAWGGAQGGGTVFALGRPWLDPYPLTGDSRDNYTGPYASLTMDAAGNFYGTTFGDGAYNKGSVFKISAMNGYWSYQLLHDFLGGPDGAYPYGGVTLAPNGHLYGTASSGGSHNEGVVWEIVP